MRKTPIFTVWVIYKTKPSRPLDWWLGGGEALSAPAVEPLPSADGPLLPAGGPLLSADGPLLPAGGPLPIADLLAASCFCACAQLKRVKRLPLKCQWAFFWWPSRDKALLLVCRNKELWLDNNWDMFLWINYSKTEPCLTLKLIHGPRTQMKNRKTGELLFEPKLNIILRTDNYIFE